jgi:predicted outer membrane repeat protein
VNSLGDTGVGTAADHGDLRYCLTQANANPGPDTITFAVTGTIQLENQLPTVFGDLAVVGPGADLLTVHRDSASPFGIFQFFGVTANVSGVTLTNGSPAIYNFSAGTVTVEDAVFAANVYSYGAGIYNDENAVLAVTNCKFLDNQADEGGALQNNGKATITDSEFSGNSASEQGGAVATNGLPYSAMTVSGSMFSDNHAKSWGGAIVADGLVTIIGSTFTGNTATLPGGGGGAIFAGGTVTVAGSVISDNFGDGGGGIINYNTRLKVSDTTLSGNSAGIGGGIFNVFGRARVTRCLISGNQAGAGASGFAGAGIASSGGSIAVIDSTLYGNSSPAGKTIGGGGIFADNNGTVLLYNSTVAGNAASYGGGVDNKAGKLLDIRDTIVAGNTASISGPDLSGAAASEGHNLFGDTSGGSGYAPTDLLDVDPMLGPLQDNGGPTPTMALLPGSPAIDAGDNTGAPAYDQRGPGYPRIVNSTIDIGAFEVQNTDVPVGGRSILATAPVTTPVPHRSPSLVPAAPGRSRWATRPAQVVVRAKTMTPAAANAYTAHFRLGSQDPDADPFALGWLKSAMPVSCP